MILEFHQPIHRSSGRLADVAAPVLATGMLRMAEASRNQVGAL